MRTITIRECAIDALSEIRNPTEAGALLLAVCCEAFGDEAPDFDGDKKSILHDFGSHTIPAVYAAIAPDIKASLSDEPTEKEIAGEIAHSISDVLDDFMGDGDLKLALVGRICESPEGEE